MSDWKVIVPATVTNMVLNPSAETTGNYGPVGGGVPTLNGASGNQRYGSQSYNLSTNADNQGMSLTLSTLANAIHYVTLRELNALGASWDWSLDNMTYTAPTLLRTDGSWRLYGLQFPAAQANMSTTLYICQNGAGTLNIYIDGVQVEQDTTYTTYCDGDQKGCEWTGAANASTSTRSAVSRAGGDIYDFHDDYHMGIREHIGSGMVPQILSLDSYAILPGGELNAVKVQPRPFSLIGVAKGYGSDCDLHQTRQDLIDILAHDAYPKDDYGWQPVLIRYQGADIEKEIAAYYESGLEATIRLENRIHEIVPIRFIAPDPHWYEIGEEHATLDCRDSATARYVMGRLRSTGQWDVLGPPAAPASGTTVNAIAVAQTKDVYIGGDFTDFATDNDADRIAQWDRTNWSWPLNEGVDNNAVEALLFGPDDTLYVAGSFTSVSGGAPAGGSRIATWDYGTSSWTTLDSGAADGTIYALAVDKDGNIYAGGNYSDIGTAVGNIPRIAYWDGAAWNGLGTGVDDNSVYAIAVGLDDTVYVGGSFNSVDTGSAYVGIAKWDATNGWASMGDTNNIVRALAVDPNDGTLYVGGDFTQIGGLSISYIAKYNGTTYQTMGTLNNTVDCLGIAPDGMLYAGGTFTTADGVTVDRIAKWNGSSWVPLDCDFPGAPFSPQAFAFGPQDPVIPTNYDVFVGFANTGTAYYSGSTAVTNNGTAPARPRFVFGQARILQIRNETTGKELSLDYTPQVGEELTINLSPTELSAMSSYYGPRNDAILAGSDVGDFMLLPGSNQITVFLYASPYTGEMLWRTPYKSFD